MSQMPSITSQMAREGMQHGEESFQVKEGIQHLLSVASYERLLRKTSSYTHLQPGNGPSCPRQLEINAVTISISPGLRYINHMSER